MSVKTLNHDPSLPDTDTLWRYMKISTLFMLLEGNAFFPSVATLRADDKLEGVLVPDATLLLTNLEHIAADKMNELLEWLEKEMDEASGKRPETACEDASRRTIFLAKRFIEELAKRRAVWCWFRSLNESAAMWSVYGAGGVAVRTSIAGLKSALPEQQDFLISPIKYVVRQMRQSTSNFDAEALENQDLIHRPHLIPPFLSP
jgi:hypothetical protein